MNTAAALINIGLDIFFLGCLGWGIWSAVMATCLSFALGTVTGIGLFAMGRMELRFTWDPLPWRYVTAICRSGVAEFFSNAADSLFQIFANSVLLQWGGAVYVAAFSIIMYIDFIAISLLRSLSDAVQPVISYCLGARRYRRIWEIETVALGAGMVLGVLVFFVMQVGGGWAAELFLGKGETETAALTVKGMAVFSWAYLFLWIGCGLGDFFTAINFPLPALVQTVSQAFLLPVLAMVVAVPFLGAFGVWVSIMIGRILAAILALLMAWKLKFFQFSCYDE